MTKKASVRTHQTDYFWKKLLDKFCKSRYTKTNQPWEGTDAQTDFCIIAACGIAFDRRLCGGDDVRVRRFVRARLCRRERTKRGVERCRVLASRGDDRGGEHFADKLGVDRASACACVFHTGRLAVLPCGGVGREHGACVHIRYGRLHGACRFSDFARSQGRHRSIAGRRRVADASRCTRAHGRGDPRAGIRRARIS